MGDTAYNNQNLYEVMVIGKCSRKDIVDVLQLSEDQSKKHRRCFIIVRRKLPKHPLLVEELFSKKHRRCFIIVRSTDMLNTRSS